MFPFAKPEYLDDDHNRLKKKLDDLIIDFFFLSKKELLFKLYNFIELLEHHDKRESEGLYNKLKECLNGAEQKELLELFSLHIKEYTVVMNNVNTILFDVSLLWKTFTSNYFESGIFHLDECMIKLQKVRNNVKNVKVHEKLVSMLKPLPTEIKDENDVKKIHQIESIFKSFLKTETISSVEMLNT